MSIRVNIVAVAERSFVRSWAVKREGLFLYWHCMGTNDALFPKKNCSMNRLGLGFALDTGFTFSE